MDLLPSIADGNLESHSLAELIASAFVTNATGTLVIEQGRSDSRLFLRHGMPCGAQLASGESTLSEVLVQARAVDAQTCERTLAQAKSTRRPHGEVLVSEGALTQDELDHFMSTLQWRHVVALCLVRQGRYELRGWEHPPPWTERVALDPLRLLVEVFRAAELSDRVRALAGWAGKRRVRRSSDYGFLSQRLGLEDVQAQAFQTADDWMSLDGFARGFVSAEDATGLGVSALLLGLLEIEPLVTAEDIITASSLLSPSLDDDDDDEDEDDGSESPTASSLQRPPPLPVDIDSSLDGIELDIDVDFGADADAPLELDLDERSWGSTNAESVDPFALASAREAETKTAPSMKFSGGQDSMHENSQLLADTALDAGLEQIERESNTPPPEGSLAEGDLFSGVDVFEPSASTGPIELEDSPTLNIRVEDLAAAFARESGAAENDTVDLNDVHDELEAPPDDWEKESSEPVENAVPTKEPEPPAPRRARPNARERLLKRAMQNLGGEAFSRVTQPIPTSAAPEPAPVPEGVEVDKVLESEVKLRLAGQRENHFKRLGVAKDATTAQIRQAFLHLAKRYHPDKLNGPGQLALQAEVREVFSLVKESYDAIVDPATRARYLMELDASSSPKSAVGTDTESAANAFNDAKRFLVRERLADAEEPLVRAVALDPKSEYLAELAWTLYRLRKDKAHDEIRALSKRSLAGKNVHDDAYLVAGYLARADGNDALAEKHFRDAYRVNSNNAKAATELRLIESRKKSGWFGRKSRTPPPAANKKTKR